MWKRDRFIHCMLLFRSHQVPFISLLVIEEKLRFVSPRHYDVVTIETIKDI